jgi:lipopolysaccharide transport system ATP-binding protein
MSDHAIILENVAKHFRKTTLRREYSTLKTELVRVLRGQRKLIEPSMHIEALKGIDLIIPKGSTTAIVGRNGSGKSTLLKIITGIYTPTSGKVTVNGRISALLELGAGFHPDFTGRENILINGIILGMKAAEVKARVDEIIRFSELGDFIDEPVRTYSSGMFMRLAFAVATHVDPEILIIDEILSVGDEHFQRKSQAKMDEFKRAGKTIIVVTHSLGTVQSWCDHAAWIDGGRIRLAGRPEAVVSEYRRAVAMAEAESARSGASALSAPGLALPELGAAPTSGEAFGLDGMTLADAQGAVERELRDRSLSVSLDWHAHGAQKLEWHLELFSPSGALLFASSTKREAEGRGTERLTLPQLPFGRGSYAVVATMRSGKVPGDSVRRQELVLGTPFRDGVLVDVTDSWETMAPR